MALQKILFKTRQPIAVFSCLLMMVGFLFGKALISIAVIILFCNALLNLSGKNYRKAFIQHRELLSITALFFIFLLSGLYSENMDIFLEKMLNKLPFLVLPFSFLVLFPMKKRTFFLLHYFFLLLMGGAAVWSLMVYINDYETITKGYLSAQVLPTPVNHIQFSIMTAYAVISGYFLFREKVYFHFSTERWLIGVSTLFLLVFLHVLAVRSGIAVFYLVVLFLIVYRMVVKKKFLLGIGLLALLIAAPFAAYFLVPTFKNKIRYMQYDLQKFRQGDYSMELSDSHRLTSMKVGLAVGMENLLIGVGLGDVSQEVNEYYEEHMPYVAKRIMPHNQFIYLFAATGLIGLFLFLILFLFPLFYKGNFLDPFFASFYILIFASFMVEAHLERQVNTSFFLLFLLLGLAYLNRQKDEPDRSYYNA